MAPEQADGQDLDGRADLFSFGILLYEMVTARSPFRASTPMASMLKAFGEPHAPVHSYNPDVPQELSDLIDWLLSKNRNDRPDNAMVVAAELTEIAGDLTENPAELAERIRMASRSWHGSGAYSRSSQSKLETEEDPLDDTVPGGPSTPSDSSRATASYRRTATLSRAAVSRAAEETMERSRLDLDRLPRESSSSRWSSMFSTAFGLAGSPPRRILAWTAWLLAILTGWWGVSSAMRPVAPEEPGDARIVVLPFENHGPEEMGYFASGLTSELIRELTSRRGLAVVSYRTSSSYDLSKKSLREIQAELDASHILEGSVSSGPDLTQESRLRINLTLVRVSDGQVVLSQSFERFATDTLLVQSEVADAVSLELGAQVFADSRRDMSTRPRALEAFFHGIDIWYSQAYSLENIRTVEDYFETAVAIDPDFVRAWTELARVRSTIVFNGLSRGEMIDDARLAIEKAEQLAPESSEVRLARAYFRYHVGNDMEGALEEFQQYSRLAPDDPEAFLGVGLLLRRLGRLEEASKALKRAFDLDRANALLASVIAETERGRRGYKDADKWFAQAQRTSSERHIVVGERAENALAIFGCGASFDQPPNCKTEEALRRIGGSGILRGAGLWRHRVHIALFDLASGGNPDDFLSVYDSVPADQVEQTQRLMMFWRKAIVLNEMGRTEESRELTEGYRSELESRYSETDYWLDLAALTMAVALLGDRELAHTQIERMLASTKADRFTGPRARKWAAAISVVLGDTQVAAEHLRFCASVSYQQSLASYEIHADPIWKPLREADLLDEVWHRLRTVEN